MDHLVSVIVITYNSSKFILETLESVKMQTYPNIELIISDDASYDGTLDLCIGWLKENEKRFAHTQVITVTQNSGISANLNRGLNSSQGEWGILCAGDDVLLPNCLEENIRYISQNTDIKALFSYCRMYKEYTTEDCFTGLNPSKYPSHIISDDKTAEDQYRLLLISNRIPFTPSFFVHLETCKKYGKIDDRYRISEDYQLYLSLTKNGIKLFFMEKETIKYRIHQEAVYRQAEEFIVHPIYFKSEACMKELSYPHLPWDIRLSKIYIWYINHVFKIDFLNRKTRLNSSLHYALSKLLNPFEYIIYIKSHYCKRYRHNIFYK